MLLFISLVSSKKEDSLRIFEMPHATLTSVFPETNTWVELPSSWYMVIGKVNLANV